MANGGEDGVGGVTGGSLEIAAAEVTLCFHMRDHGLDGGAAAQLALDGTEHPRFWPEMKTRCGFGASWPRYPLST